MEDNELERAEERRAKVSTGGRGVSEMDKLLREENWAGSP